MILSWVSFDVLGETLSKLSSGQRFEALRRVDEAGSNEWRMGNWFLIGVFSLLAMLLLLFIFVSIERARKERKIAKLSVARKGRQIGLTAQQLQIIGEIADKSGLPNKEGVFSIEEAFDRGAEKIIEQNLAKGLVSEEIVRLKAELAGLRERIGFKNKKSPEPAVKTAAPKQPTTRQISAGRIVYLTRRANPSDSGIETAIIENNENEIRVKLNGNIKINFGDSWRVRYSYGASVWEFESSVIGYDGNILRLSHNDSVRFFSRRRFEPVAVNQQALLASFPFCHTDGGQGAEQEQPQSTGSPVFLPMTITAIAGPWLRLETVHLIKANQRVLVVMKIDNAVAKPGENGFETQTIEDIGEVKNVEQKEGGFIVAVELTGLSDSDIDHLVGVARRAAVKSATLMADKEGTPQVAAEEKGAENPELATAGTGR